jgi:ClpP class serine protease
VKVRRDLIKEIEAERKTKVITYVLSDRQGGAAQIAEDAVRPMFDHLRGIGKTEKIDLFLYSVGGLTDVPWRIVTMIREFAEEFAVLIPYKAMSAATMISLGADEVVMGRKGELGPIDPQMSIQRGGDGGTAVQQQIAVEDIISYVRFLREKAGLSDQAALTGPISALAGKVDPWILGSINRAHSHIRDVARKLLTARSKQRHPDEQRIQVIVETLAERTYQHGHAIGRREAKEIGLNIIVPSDKLEDLIWQLYEQYETFCKIREPIEPRTFVPQGQDEHSEALVMGAIESVNLSHEFSATMRGRNKRQMPPQVSLNMNLNLQLPPNVQPQQLPAAAQQVIQQMMQQLQAQIPGLVQQQLQNQMPKVGFEGWTEAGRWRQRTDWPKDVTASSAKKE